MKRIGVILVLVITFAIAWYDFVFNEGQLLEFLSGYLVLVLLAGMLLGILGLKRLRP